MRLSAVLRGVLAIALVAATECSAAAQQRGGEGQPPGGVISGTVIDAGTMAPLPGAVVTIEPESGGVLPPEPGAGAFLGAARSVVADAEGEYRFSGLPPGRYRLRIARVGYRPATLAVELRGTADSRVSVGLTVEPVPLEPVDVLSPPAQPFGRDRGVAEEAGAGRVRAARARQEATLATDARELTYADVVESVTLGETDLFRALHRVPGVTTRDDYSAQLWIRGASWDQTRVLFDGLPLFNPVHAFGLLAAVNPDAVGGALLHPGVAPAALPGAAAAVVDIATRAGGGDGDIRALADLSLASGRLAADRTFDDGRGAWMLAARRTWIDLVAGAVSRLAGDPGLRMPYDFSDLTGRFDYGFEGGGALEVSGLYEVDRVRSDLPDLIDSTRATWGNTAARATYSAAVGELRTRNTLGLTRYSSGIRSARPDTASPLGAPTEPPGDNEVVHLEVSGEIGPAASGAGGGAWSTGYALVHERATYDGPPVRLPAGYRPEDLERIRISGQLSYGALWGTRRWEPRPALSIETGLRLEAGPAVENGGVVRASPRLLVRLAPNPELTLSLGAGRSYQYAQTIGTTGPLLGAAAAASDVWVVTDEQTPVLRADIATAGLERWLGGEWLAGANAYLRRATGVALPDPRPGLVDGRPLWVEGVNTARGIELSGRRLAGRWTAALAYSYGVSEMEAAGLRFPAASDRRHALDATAVARVAGSLRLGAAFAAASGAPYTRVFTRYWSCGQVPCDDLRPRLLEPNAHRAPTYSSMDLLVDWTGRLRSWEIGVYLQVHNALGHDNAVTYSATGEICPGRGYTSLCETEYELYDEFERGLPTLPVIGVRARF